MSRGGLPRIAVLSRQYYSADGLIAAIWDDGTTVWSRDRTFGGPPYFISSSEPRNLTLVRERLEMLMGQLPAPERQHVVTHSPYIAIYVINGGDIKSLASCHEPAEASGAWIGTQNGLSLVSYRDKWRILGASSQDYLLFRDVWDKCRAEITSCLPLNRKGPLVEVSRPEVDTMITSLTKIAFSGGCN
jgi:hypothetical protein